MRMKCDWILCGRWRFFFLCVFIRLHGIFRCRLFDARSGGVTHFNHKKKTQYQFSFVFWMLVSTIQPSRRRFYRHHRFGAIANAVSHRSNGEMSARKVLLLFVHYIICGGYKKSSFFSIFHFSPHQKFLINGDVLQYSELCKMQRASIL